MFLSIFLAMNTLPRYPGPGRVLGKAQGHLLEVTVYFGRRPRLGGTPAPKYSAQGEVIVFIYDSDLAELRPGGWEKLEGEREEQNLNKWMEPVREDNLCPLPLLGFMPSR